ncbi:hypothetical protein KKE85_03135, partial [Patescibacteria group bacterium]|nr:hypothetical protein [Patescibacteria group bacterium]
MLKQLTKILFLAAAIFILTFVGSPLSDFRQESASAASGSVLNFDGGDYLKVADSAVLDQGNRLTLSIWAKPDVAGDRYIIYRGSAYYLKLTSSCAIEG